MKLQEMITRCLSCMAVAGLLVLSGCGEGADAQSPARSAAAADSKPETATPKSPFKLVADQSTSDAPTGNWGTLRGRFVVDGTAPQPDNIVPTKDTDFCGQHNLVDQSLVVNKDNQLANVFVYVYVPRGRKLDVHESYAETEDAEVVLDNSKCQFEPHCATLRLSQKLVVKNSDPVGHNTNLASRQEPFNLTVPTGGSIEQTFKVAQSYPLPVKCNIHPWMNGHLLIREDPYMALSQGDGTFEIQNIPAGTHAFVFWHERPGTLRDVTAGEGKTDRRGRLEIEIPAGQVVDLGDIKVPAALLKAQ